MKGVRLELLGNCRVRFGGQVIDNIPRKAWIFLEYLYFNREKAVNAEEISQAIWDGKQKANLSNSIKVLVFELRSSLDAFGKDAGKAILLNVEGDYQLSAGYDYSSDAEDFEMIAGKALGGLADESQRKALLDKAISLYEGNVVLMDVKCQWQRDLRKYYMELMEKVVIRKAGMLCAEGKRREAKSLCEEVYLTIPLSKALRSKIEELSVNG